MATNGGLYISQVKQLQDRIFERILLEHNIDIRGNQGRILFILWNNGNISMTELSDKTALAKNTLSVVVEGMVNKGILKREVNPNNRRQVVISLTDYAKGLKSTFEAVSNEMGLIFYKGFENEEIERFEGFLARILDNLKERL